MKSVNNIYKQRRGCLQCQASCTTSVFPFNPPQTPYDIHRLKCRKIAYDQGFCEQTEQTIKRKWYFRAAVLDVILGKQCENMEKMHGQHCANLKPRRQYERRPRPVLHVLLNINYIVNLWRNNRRPWKIKIIIMWIENVTESQMPTLRSATRSAETINNKNVVIYADYRNLCSSFSR